MRETDSPWSRQHFNEDYRTLYAARDDAEAEVQAACMTHPDYREAYEAFIEKRPKEFTKYKRDGSEA